MNATHTPTPWEIHTWQTPYCYPHVQIRSSMSKKYICGFPSQTGDKEPPDFDKSLRKNYYDDPQDAAQNLANARLIVTAPELLSALRLAALRLTPPTRGALKGYVSPELALIRATIAKAEGRSE